MEEDLLVAEPESPPEPDFSFATVGAVYADGVSLIFDGETEPSEKHYLTNTSVVFRAGDRVKIAKDAGTYVCEYVVGAPGATAPHELPAGGSTEQVLSKTSNADYSVAWRSTHEIPAGGAQGKVLKKKTAADYNVEWADEAEGLPAGGTTGQALVKKSGTNYDAQWAELVPAKIENKINSAASYAIEFRTTTTYGTPVFQIRMGPYGTWYTLTTS